MSNVTIKRNLSTQENISFWDYVEKCAEEVKTWPDWMRSSEAFQEEILEDE